MRTSISMVSAVAVVLSTTLPSFAEQANSQPSQLREPQSAYSQFVVRRGLGYGGWGYARPYYGGYARPYYGYGGAYGYYPRYRYGYYGGPYYRGGYYGGGYYGGAAAAGIAGLAAGALIGGALATQPVYAAPAYSNSVQYCIRRFKSYDLSSGTYLGLDGYRHACP